MPEVKTYYWNKRNNFGDQLAPLLLRRFSGLGTEWRSPEEAELLLIGSVLDQISSTFSGVIAGAGKLHEKTKLSFPYAKILAVRGPLTAKGLKGNIVYGDPGLMADELIGSVDKEYNLGLVPHWTDLDLKQRKEFLKYDPLIINVADDPLTVIRQIGMCKKIVSSSLHGIIIADAFGIPRRIEIAPRMLSHSHQEGGLFKWEDYELSIGRKLEVGVTVEANRNTINEKKHEIFDVFEEISEIFTPDKPSYTFRR